MHCDLFLNRLTTDVFTLGTRTIVPMCTCVIEMTLLRLSAERRTAYSTAHEASHRIGVFATTVGRVIMLLDDLLNVVKEFLRDERQIGNVNVFTAVTAP